MLVRPSVVQVSKYGEYTWRGNACGGLVGAAETAGAIAARMGRIAAERAIRRDRRAMRNLPGVGPKRLACGSHRQGSLRRVRSTGPTGTAAAGTIGGLGRGFALRILDLLEDLAHPGTHQGAVLRLGLAIAPAEALLLARVEVVVGVHRRIVGRTVVAVNRDARRRSSTGSDVAAGDDHDGRSVRPRHGEQ